ncbi:9117_t:CDS:1, partial [Gigaspora rosea]
ANNQKNGKLLVKLVGEKFWGTAVDPYCRSLSKQTRVNKDAWPNTE